MAYRIATSQEEKDQNIFWFCQVWDDILACADPFPVNYELMVSLMAETGLDHYGIEDILCPDGCGFREEEYWMGQPDSVVRQTVLNALNQ